MKPGGRQLHLPASGLSLNGNREENLNSGFP